MHRRSRWVHVLTSVLSLHFGEGAYRSSRPGYTPAVPPPATALAAHWTLDPAVTFLNHGSFGACPRAVLEAQAEARARLEREPVHFFTRCLERELAEARSALAGFLGADPDDLAFVPNATAGVNTVLRSLDLEAGDELLVTDHEYRACRNALDFVAARAGARVVVAALPFPVDSAATLAGPILAAVGPRTRLALLDQVTSPTGLVLPIDALVEALTARGVETLVDAAHAAGMLELRLDRTGAAWTTGNCHKWLCAPKGAAFLHVRRDRQPGLRPLGLSHGASLPAGGRTRFRLEHDWTGTHDPTAHLAVPAAIRCLEEMVPGGWPEVRRRNHALVLEGRDAVCDALGVPAPCPAALVGSLASIPLPRPADARSPPDPDPLHHHLWAAHRIEVPVFPWPALGLRILRLSAQLYNHAGQYRALAAAAGAAERDPNIAL